MDPKQNIVRFELALEIEELEDRIAPDGGETVLPVLPDTPAIGG